MHVSVRLLAYSYLERKKGIFFFNKQTRDIVHRCLQSRYGNNQQAAANTITQTRIA